MDMPSGKDGSTWNAGTSLAWKEAPHYSAYLQADLKSACSWKVLILQYEVFGSINNWVIIFSPHGKELSLLEKGIFLTLTYWILKQMLCHFSKLIVAVE